MGHGLMQQWRRVQKAKADGLSSYEFHLAEEKQRIEDERAMHRMTTYQRGRVAAERSAAPSTERRPAPAEVDYVF
jgi:hypothetical protein